MKQLSRISSIYKATNRVNGKSYIGFDSKWPRRMHQHLLCNYYCHFHNALQLYGADNFQWEIIYQSLDREHTLKIMEPYFIKEYDSYLNGYNQTLGGDGKLGYTVSQVTRDKMSKTLTGKPKAKCKVKRTCSEEWRRKISETLKGRKLTEIHKENMRKAHKGRKLTEIHKENMKKAWVIRRAREKNYGPTEPSENPDRDNSTVSQE